MPDPFFFGQVQFLAQGKRWGFHVKIWPGDGSAMGTHQETLLLEAGQIVPDGHRRDAKVVAQVCDRYTPFLLEKGDDLIQAFLEEKLLSHGSMTCASTYFRFLSNKS